MKVMSINIRYKNDSDEMSWDKRKSLMIEMVKEIDPDMIGFQEVLPIQLDYLLENLGHEFDYYGVYRDASSQAEMNPIFIKKSLFEIESRESLWLSENPHIENVKGWDADLARIVSIIKLRIKDSNEELVFMNTHFDHMGKIARNKSGQLILDLVDKYNNQNLPVIVTGDFNTRPEEGLIDNLLNANNLINSYTLFEDKENSLSIHDFSGEIKGSPIDYIFMNESLNPKYCELIRYEKDGVYTSDHWHVLCEIE